MAQVVSTGTQYVSEWHEGEPSQRAGLDVFQHSQQQLKPGAPPLLPLFPTAPDLPPRVRESPQPTLISPEVQIPVLAASYLAGNIAAMPRSERPQWDWNSPLPQFAPFTGASTANGKEGESSMQAAMVGPTRYHPLTRAGAATAGNAGQPIHFVLSDRNTREVEFQQPASKRYQLDLTSEPPEFPASGQRITRLPGSALPQFRPSYLTDGNNGPESYQLGAASFAGHVLPSHLPFYSYHGNMPQFNQVETVGLPGLAHPPHPLFYSSGIERPSPSQLGTQALPGSALPAESSVCSNDFQSTRCNSLQRERALKAVAPLVGPPPPKYGSASSVGNANAIEAGSLSCNIDYMEKNLRKSENKRSTVLYAVEDNDATSNLRKSPHQGTESLGCFTSRAWAWLMSIWIRNKDAAISETNKHFGQSFQKLTSACLTRHDSLHEASSSASAPSGPSEPIKFAYLLWAINKRALEVLKGKQRVPTYLDEQKDFMKWFIDFMTNCKDLGHCSDLEGDFLHEKIMTALDSKDVNSGFEVILPEIPPTHHVLANKDALMNEAAARAVMRYHKEKNFPLFNLYGNIGFVQKLAAFGSRWCYRYVPQPGRRIPRPNQGFHKTRWEKYVEKYVKPINFSAGKAAEQPTEPFALEDQGPKVWAWLITSNKFNKNTRKKPPMDQKNGGKDFMILCGTSMAQFLKL
ncbi:hypothetical protein VP01_547g6 [Puccinia sorghi]|uniref:Uncharacterized protein n=1 Tax=Puccinia sorghi TaxID=27349 RepID=A0A0L6UK85_9BASI|nr:hypothetical protein VP01_547g6 [Puccinia sorghi]